MAEYNIKSATTGQIKYTGTMRYVGTFLKPGYCEFQDIGSPTKINWEVGDYIDYPRTGLRYKLYTIPSQAKQSQANEYGAAFLYENVQFFDATKDLEMPFIDLVPDDNEESFSTLNTVAFVGTPENVAERVQACLNHWLPNANWEIRIISGLNPSTDTELIEILATEAEFNVSGATCQEALEKMYDIWNGLGWSYSFENSKNVITIGAPNKRTASNTTGAFSYGNGLTHLRKTTGNADEIGTRLFAFGSMKNMLGNYYRDKDIKDADSVDIEHLMLPINAIASLGYAGWGLTDSKPDARKAFIENANAIAQLGLIPKYAYFDGTDDNYPEIFPSIEGVTIGDIIDAKDSGSENMKCSVCGYEYDPEVGDPESGIAPGTPFENLPDDWVCPICGAGKDEFVVPDVPELAHYTRADRVDEVLVGTSITDDGTQAKGGSKYTQLLNVATEAGTLTNIGSSDPFSLEILSIPVNIDIDAKADITAALTGYVDIENGVIDELSMSVVVESAGSGVEEFPITLTPTATVGRYSFNLNKTSKDVPFSNGIGYLTANVVVTRGGYGTIDFSAVINAGTISVGVSEKLADTFKIRIPQIGFDIDQYADLGEGKTISMKSGLCAGRDFKIKSTKYISSTDCWELTCSRSKDDDMGVLFPNVDSQIDAGDRFVLLDIAMPELYIKIASVRLLKAAQKLLADIDHIKPYYEPEIDAKHVDSNPEVLREGMYMHLVTDEIVDGGNDYAIIDSLEIDENGLIPTFVVKLRKKKAVTWTENISKGSTTKSSSDTSKNEDYITESRADKKYQPKGDYPTRKEVDMFFERYTLPNNAGTAIKLKEEYAGMFADGWISAGGLSTGGGGGGSSLVALRSWANYNPNDTLQVLGSNLGKALKDTTDTLAGYFTGSAANNALALGGHAESYFAHQVKLGTVAYNAIDGIVSLPAYPTTLPASDVYAWAKKAALDVNDVPNITTGKISDLETWIANKGFVTKAVNDLTNYYLKSETYTQAEVNALIAAINQFHYEIYASLSDITTPATNVLYLIGPTGSGSDRYEEYVYSNGSFVKIGDTSIDLSGYVNAITRSYESDVYECPDCDYVYNPAIGDPSSGIAPGTSFDDLPDDWVCPVCGASKEDFGEGRQFVYGVNKSNSTIAFTHGRIRLKNIDGVDDLKAIEALTGTSGLLRKTAINTWTLDTSSYLTGITSAMVVAALGYTPFNAANFTQANIQSTLGISNWALASTKPSYNFDEIGLKPLTLSGYGIRDAYINNGTITLGSNSITPLTQHQSLTGYVNAIAEAGQTDMYTCPVCGYRYDPAVGDPDSGITPGTPFADLPSDWECPICQTGKDEFELGGTQYVKAVSKPASSSTITFTEGRVSLADIDGANSLKGIAYLSGTSGILKKTGPTTWELDPNAFPTSARELTDADDLCYVDPDEGVTVIIDDPGVTGTVLWGAESANQVALSVNGVSKLLLKSAAIAGLESSISTLSGYFINGSARNALSLGGHNAAYFASASGLTALQEVVSGKQDTINDLANIRSGAGHGETAYGWGNHASAGYATQSWVNGQLALYPYQIVVNGDAFGSVNGTIELPDYPTTLPASDVYAWAKASTKPSYTFSEIGSKPTTLAGYGITDAYISNGTITLGSNSITPLTSHQSLSGYAHQVVVNGDAFEAVNSVIELPDYPTTLPASDVYAWAKAATKPTYTATEVGLGNVTNDAQVKRTEMGAASGVATLGTDGKIPASQLPSYVDDVLEYASLSAFPATGESGKIYVALDTNKTYRWSGTTYTEISPSIVIGTTTGTAFDGGSGYAHVTDGDIHVTAALKTAWSAKYDLPSGGIPSTDLASAIQTSLGHGDTAYGWGDHALAGYFPATSFTQANIQSTLGISNWALAASKPSYNFSEIGSTPTTLSGYGITDAKIENGVITLGSNTITPLTQHQSLTGYVNAISPSAETDVYLCPDCDYFYDPAIGDPIGGIAVGTAFADLPSDWVCPICGASKEDFTAGGRQFVSGVSKSSGSSTVSFTLNRLALRDLSGANNLKAIEYASGSGLLKKNADGTWGFDANSYLTGITSAMVTGALGYTPFDSANFTQANIQSTLGISNWALAASKPSYAFSELSSHPTTLSGYGITDAAAASDLLAYLPLSGGSMTGQLVVPLLKINGPTTDYVELASLAGELYVGSGALSRLVFDTGNYTSYVYTKAQINEKDGILASGIAGNSARLDSIEDWILGVNADTVGLGLVENVALSTWAGSGNITTLGTITTGVWNGTNIAANKLAIDFNWVLVGNAATYDTDDHVVVN